MRLIDNVTDEAKQDINILLPDGSIVLLSLNFSEATKQWFYDLTFGTFKDFGNVLTISPNLTRQYKNVLPFGIACQTKDMIVDPFLVDDFLGDDARCKLWILTEADVLALEALAY